MNVFIPRSYPVAIAYLAWRILCFALFAPVAWAASPTAYQARTWDTDLTIPPNSYRAPRPIELIGPLEVKVEAGTYIESVEFTGREKDQNWKVEGALFRRVKIGSMLGSRFEAKGAGFDDCDFRKVGGWFVAFWGTRWKFENCVIAKGFLPENIHVGDYGIVATNCTFIGVKFPAIGLKNNPAEYVQQKDFRFESCRFIQCEVPEPILAATISCAFENCNFPAKRHDWPKETGPIRVQAYYTGSGRTPQSFLNGPFAVQFAAATPDLAVGSTLNHTYSGGKLAIASIKPAQQFATLGSVTKKASEIPDLGPAPVAPGSAGIGSLPTFPGAGSGTASPPTGKELRSLDEILRHVPPTVDLAPGGQPNPTAVDLGNGALQQNVEMRPILMRVRVESLAAFSEDGYAFRLIGREMPLTYRATTIPARAVALFRSDQAAQLGRVPKGGEVVVRGTVSKALVHGRGRGLGLTVTIADAQVQ